MGTSIKVKYLEYKNTLRYTCYKNGYKCRIADKLL